MNCDGWQIRAGTAADVSALLELWERAGSIPTVTDDADSLLGLLAHDADSLLVAEIEGALVGSLIVGWDGWRASFYRLAVGPSVRRQGVGRALVEEGERRLRRRGAVRLTAIVAATEEVAVAFWTGVGYQRQLSNTRFVRNF